MLFSPIRRTRNLKRRFIFKKKFDFAYFHFPAEFENRHPPSKPFYQRLIFPESSFSIEYFENVMERITNASKGRGLIIELPLDISLSFGIINQLHRTLRTFKESGKKIVIISKHYDLRSYAFASIADKVLLIPGGILDTRGVAVSIPFLKNGLEKLGLEFEKIAVSGYKAALDNYVRDDIAPEYKENMEWLLKEQVHILETTIKENRAIHNFENLLNDAPYTEDKSLELGYIDGVIRPDELPEFLKTTFNLKKIRFAQFKRVHKYLLIPKGKKNETVAVIPVTGTIIDGFSRGSPPISPPIPVPFVGEDQAGDQSIIQSIRQVMRNPSIVGTILFVDSPGGSALASETIRSALVSLSKKMPVIAYFNSVAASGGYYISTATQWIISEPGCITGSIGVVSGRLSVKKFAEKYNINTSTIKIGENADWGSVFEKYRENEKESAIKIMNALYDKFLDYVAQNRSKTREEIIPIAGGRVYTGTQAFENGLVDQVGSLHDAYLKICELVQKKPNLSMCTIHPQRDSEIPPIYVKQKTLFNLSDNFYIDMMNYFKPFFQTKLWMKDFDLIIK